MFVRTRADPSKERQLEKQGNDGGDQQYDVASVVWGKKQERTVSALQMPVMSWEHNTKGEKERYIAANSLVYTQGGIEVFALFLTTGLIHPRRRLLKTNHLIDPSCGTNHKCTNERFHFRISVRHEQTVMDIPRAWRCL